MILRSNPINHLEELFARLVVMQKECISGAGAVPFFIYQQEVFPYFTNRLGETPYEFDSEDYSVRRYTVIMRYIIAHMTEGQPGAPETRLYTDVPLIEDYFFARPGFISATYPTDIQGLAATEMNFQRSRGTAIFQTSGISVLQVGTEFTLTAPFHLPIDYA